MFRKYPSSYGTNRLRSDSDGRIQQGSSHMEYEEIESYVECPTCQGAGRISKESEAEYVALIPLTDKRLRPRRTYLYVGITFAVCIFVIVLLVIFLTPRSINLNNERRYIEPSLSVVDDNGAYTKVSMILTNKVNLTNGNYFHITVAQLQMSVSIGDIIVKTVTQKPNAGVAILGRTELSVTTNLTLNNPLIKITSYCVFDDFILRTLYMRFSFTVTATFNGQHMEATYSAVQGVDCYPTANKTTGKPPLASEDYLLEND